MGEMDSVLLPDWVGLFAVDPGGKTGCAEGLFELRRAKTVGERFAQGSELRSWEVHGDELEQGVQLATEFEAFRRTCWASGVRRVELVIEDFNLRPTGIGSTARAGLAPVRVTSTMLGVRIGKALQWETTTGRVSVGTDVPVVYQQPSEIKGFATNARLKKWGVYVVGSDHRRDAVRHLAVRLAKL